MKTGDRNWSRTECTEYTGCIGCLVALVHWPEIQVPAHAGRCDRVEGWGREIVPGDRPCRRGTGPWPLSTLGGWRPWARDMPVMGRDRRSGREAGTHGRGDGPRDAPTRPAPEGRRAVRLGGD